jgi:hypothetical protein
MRRKVKHIMSSKLNHHILVKAAGYPKIAEQTDTM